MRQSPACDVCLSLLELADKLIIERADSRAIAATLDDAADSIEVEAGRMRHIARQLKEAAEFLKTDM
jgi:hypothetical protein